MQAEVKDTSTTDYTREYQITLLCTQGEAQWFGHTYKTVPSGPVSVVLQSVTYSRLHIRISDGSLQLECAQFLWNRLDELNTGEYLVIDLKYDEEWSFGSEDVFEVQKVTWS